MTPIRPVLLLAALALVHVAQASITCNVCGGTDGYCPPDAPTGRPQKCPDNVKFCIVDAVFKSTANTLPATTVKTTSTARPGGSSTTKPGGMQLHYKRKCGNKGMTKPAGYYKEGDLLCKDNSKWNKTCYCKKENCNNQNPTAPKDPKKPSDAASNAAKLSMVVAMGILAYVL